MTDLSRSQTEALAEAYRAKLHGDGWLIRGQSRIWRTAPNALGALGRKHLMEVIPQYGRAKLTPRGLKLVEADPERFGLKLAAGERGAHGAMLADRDQTSVAQVGKSGADAERASASEPAKETSA